MIGGVGERRERWLLEVASRRKWLAVVVFATTLAAGVTVARHVPNVYEATATVLVEEGQADLAAAGKLDRRLQLITQEIQSRSRLEKLIQDYGLYPHLRGRYPAEVMVQRMRRDIRTEFKAPPVAGGPGSTLAFAITYRAPAPDTAARVANALAAFYLDEDVKIRGRKANEAVQVLKDQLDEVTRKLQEQRQKLGAHPDGAVDLPEQTAVDLAALGRVHADLRSASDERLRALDRRNDLLRRLAEAESAGPAAAAEPPTRLARLRGELAELRRRYSDKYPDVIRVQAEIAALEKDAAGEKPVAVAAAPPAAPASAAVSRLKESLADVDTEIARLKASEESLRAEITGYTERLDTAPRRQRAFEEASRDYQATRDTYDTLRRRYEQAQLDDVAEGSTGEPRFRILDAAVVPPGPAAPNRMMLLAVALLAALASSAGAVGLREQLDTSFHAVDDVNAFTRVPVLASIPRIVTAKDLRTSRMRFCLAALAVILGLVAVTQTFRNLARIEDGVIATLARSRS